ERAWDERRMWFRSFAHVTQLTKGAAASPFFLGKITLGQMTQTAGAFGRVESSLTFFIARYQSLASYKAVVERLTTFRSAIEEARRLGTKPPRIERVRHLGRDLVLRDLVLCVPDG